MSRKSKLLAIKNALAPDSTGQAFQSFGESIKKLENDLKENVHAATLEDVNSTLDKFKGKIDLKPLISGLEDLRTATEGQINALAEAVAQKTTELEKLSQDSTSLSNSKTQDLADEISSLKEELAGLAKNSETDRNVLDSKISEIIVRTQELSAASELKSKEDLNKLELVIKNDRAEDTTARTKAIDDLNTLINKVRIDLVSMINSRGGGSINRQMFIGGVDPLTKYTDVNFKAGTNVTLSYANNNTTKKVDITIAATGGQGSTRAVNSTAVSSTLGSAAGTDYVAICSAGVKMSLPAASGNTNLYTIKNTAASSVLVAPNGVDTVDGQSNIILATQYTSVDLISDGVSNWNIT